MTSLRVSGWLRWKKFILPAIFPSCVTGGITAAGGAWNASIVAEVVVYGHNHLTATASAPTSPMATDDRELRRDILVGVIGDERLRRRRQPAALAPPVRPGRTRYAR